jgi:myosin heavy subunit
MTSHTTKRLSDANESASRNLSGVGLGADEFYYTNQGDSSHVDTLNDVDEFSGMIEAMEALGIDEMERMALLDLVAFVIKLGMLLCSD